MRSFVRAMEKSNAQGVSDAREGKRPNPGMHGEAGAYRKGRYLDWAYIAGWHEGNRK